MRNRDKSKSQTQSSGRLHVNQSIHDAGTLARKSQEGVNKLLRRSSRLSSSGKKEQDGFSLENDLKTNEQEVVHTMDVCNASTVEGCHRDAIENSQAKEQEVVHSMDVCNASNVEDCHRDAIENSQAKDQEVVHSMDAHNASPGDDCHKDTLLDDSEEMNDSDWEDGPILKSDPVDRSPNERMKGLTIEFDEPSGSTGGRKPVRRASAEDKELAELVHKVHLLCLLARGRLIDNACDDSLIQASLLSLLPTHLLKISEVSNITANALTPLVTWFHDNFHVRNLARAERSFRTALATALETHEGTPEEIAALSVALFRALKFTARFVSILDVASLKPEADKYEPSNQAAERVSGGIFSTSTLMVDNLKRASIAASPVQTSPCNEKDGRGKSSRKSKGGCSTSNVAQFRDSTSVNESTDGKSTCQVQPDTSRQCVPKNSLGLKRKGDLEFEMQLAMAISATSVETHENIHDSSDGNNSLEASIPTKRWKRIERVESASCSQGFSTALGSRKVGSPLFWAEVYCDGENLTGKWVHVDAVNAIIDGEQKVEDAAAACKTSLRYVVAFAGHGAKDVTRRFQFFADHMQLESGGTGGTIKVSEHPGENSSLNHVILPEKSGQEVSKEYGSKIEVESSVKDSFVATRNSLEDMELETRALTEPLPTNQQAYKNHALYALERWLTKYQILHPKGPILGFCSGHPVYPRSCVQTLKTRERWLREGLQIKGTETPVKVLEQSTKLKKARVSEDVCDEIDSKETIELYGKWQLEPLLLPRAVNGIVPKNERGQVDVWSEKCLPPGTVHIRLPRVFVVAKRLEIDYAPAMVGFEFRNGRAVPVYDGIVVCTEFKDAILEAYAEEEERRAAEEKKRTEAQAISRWYQLLSSVITRQMLNSYYQDSSSSQPSGNIQDKNIETKTPVQSSKDSKQPTAHWKANNQDTTHTSLVALEVGHEHVFLTKNESFDAENSIRTKRCECGFSIQVEEL
ncbi:DNA repair protein complementing XP-C cells-like protein isoform X1 [Gossypium australe]|uniref:DNA repair protein complementing XP-C cells-like protein isoform X1 n=1 Tax=Gossypium australe TaxID=47621 RepID=A0A5B6UKU5_9ROSI|nr:DNA repair protein complementing XP-C cells-like protein isoform X1 [Gossypium australe]